MPTSGDSVGGGIWFVGLLTIVFITLKLLGQIEWSWWWVLGAFWIPIVVFIFGATVLVVVGFLFAITKSVIKNITMKL